MKIDLEGEVVIDQKVFQDEYIDFEYIKNNSNLIQITINSKDEKNPLNISTTVSYDRYAFSKGILLFALLSIVIIVLSFIGS